MKLFFLPFSVLGGILAGLVAKKVFEVLWGLFDDQEPPDAEHRDVGYGKLAAALVLQGAISRLVRGFFDHGARQGFERMTGAWPGEEAPEPE